jgi:hypothetical protein
MSTSTRWKNRPVGSTWGDFGPDDQAGRMNLLTREKVMQGMAEVKHGITFNLSLPLDYPGASVLNPRRSAPVLRPTVRNGKPNMNYQLWCDDPLCTDVISDDLVIMHLQYSTQWDSLAHAGSMFDADGDGVPEPLYYNGYRAGIDVVGPDKPEGAGIFDFINIPKESTSYAKALGIEHMAERCVQGRAVMVDLHAHLGHTGEAVGYDTWMRILEKDRIEVESGDMVCIHTGFGQVLMDMKRQPDADVLSRSGSTLDGRDDKLKQWITDSGLIALIADNYAVEAHPATPGDGACATLPLHEHCLFKLGVHLGELWYMTHLATWLRENKRNRFLLTAPPLRLPGAIGSPAAPVATV